MGLDQYPNFHVFIVILWSRTIRNRDIKFELTGPKSGPAFSWHERELLGSCWAQNEQSTLISVVAKERGFWGQSSPEWYRFFIFLIGSSRK